MRPLAVRLYKRAMDAKFIEKIVDVKLLRGDLADTGLDSVLLRLRTRTKDDVRVDAVVRLDVIFYVHPDDGSDLVEIMGEHTLPKTMREIEAEGFTWKNPAP